MTVAILQSNLQHKKVATSVLDRRIRTKGMDLALILEPWVKNKKVLGFNAL